MVGASGPAIDQFNERGGGLITGASKELIGVWHCGPDHNEFLCFYRYLRELPNDNINILYDDAQIIFTGRHEDHILRALRNADGSWVESSLWTREEIETAVGECEFRDYTDEPFCYGPAGKYFSPSAAASDRLGPLYRA